jgi:hypothetical protein
VIRALRAGARVRVTRGEHEGRIGVVQAVSIDGAAVRLAADGGRWPFPDVRVVPLGDLVRVPRPRWRVAMPDAMEAPF